MKSLTRPHVIFFLLFFFLVVVIVPKAQVMIGSDAQQANQQIGSDIDALVVDAYPGQFDVHQEPVVNTVGLSVSVVVSFGAVLLVFFLIGRKLV